MSFAPAIQQRFFTPSPDLIGLVNNVMINQVDSPSGTFHHFPFPPLPEQSILFYPHDRPLLKNVFTGASRTGYACTIVGPQTERFELGIGSRHLIIKIGLQPGALHRLTHIPMTKFLDCTDLDGEAVFPGSLVREALEQFACVNDFNEMNTIAETFVRSVARSIIPGGVIDLVAPLILRSGGLIKMDDLASHAFLSARQFHRRFTNHIGLSPKFFSRQVRFAKAWLLREVDPSLPWISIAHECGYFDQMHLIRDFKEFTGASPMVIADELKRQSFSLNNRVFT
jgi:AraC-like DNA-binding protein